MKRRLFPLAVALSVLVSGCRVPKNTLTGSGSIRDILRTASGYVLEAGKQAAATIEFGRIGVEQAKEAAQEIKRRAENVKQGIQTVQEGKELIEKGIGTK